MLKKIIIGSAVLMGFLMVVSVALVLWDVFTGKEKKVVANEAHQSTLPVIASAEEMRAARIDSVRTILKNEISGFDSLDYNTDQLITGGGLSEIALFKIAAQHIYLGNADDDSINQELSIQLAQRLEKLQVKEFPILRKQYAKTLGDNLWENDVYVRTVGKNHQYIVLQAIMFGANKNIKTFHGQIENAITMLRFKEARYTMYKGSPDFTTFRMPVQEDDFIPWDSVELGIN